MPTTDKDVGGLPGAQTSGGTLAQRVTAATATAALGTPVMAAMGVIYVKGGVVVGYSTEDAAAVFGELGLGTLEPSVGVRVGSPFCTGSSVDLQDGLPVGEYQAFPVVRTHASPTVAGWRAVIEGPHPASAGTAAGGPPASPPPPCQAIAGANFGPHCLPSVCAPPVWTSQA